MRKRHMHRSGGREPTVVWESHLLRQFRIHSQTIVVRKPWSGGCQPAVVRETRLQERFRKVAADCRPVCWRTPLQSRLCNHGGLTPPALVRAKMRLYSVKVAFSPANERRAPGAASVSPPWLGESRGRHNYVHIRTQSSDG